MCRPTEGTLEERRRQMDRDTVRRRNLKRLYGITPDEYDELRATQGYRCAICQRHEDDLPSTKVGRPRLGGGPSTQAMKLHVDHDHDTNAIRGLLCWSCNTGIGVFQDRVDWMTSAIAYVSAGIARQVGDTKP